MSEKPPAFQFYPKDFLSDIHVATMTAEEVGAYVLLLCHCWLEGRLPNDPKRLAKLCRMDEPRFDSVRGALEPRFTLDTTSNTFRHERLDREREKQTVFRESQRLKGVASGSSRRSKSKEPKRTAVQSGSNPIEPNMNSAICNLQSAISDLPMKTSPPSGKRRPLALGLQRLRIWDWQLDEILASLGDHAEAFDVPRWLQEVEGREGSIIPPSGPEQWAWLKAELAKEITARKLTGDPDWMEKLQRELEAEAREEADV